MKRQPGRPRLDDDDDTVQVCVKLPGAQYDALYAEAQKTRTSVPEVIRRELPPGKSPKPR